MYDSFGQVEEVSGFKHTAFNEAVKEWSASLYPFPLHMYDFKPMSEPQALVTVDFASPLYCIEQPLALTVTQSGRVNCCVVWCEYYVGDRAHFEDIPENWISVYRNGQFENYKKQLLHFCNKPFEVKEGDAVSGVAVLNEKLEFQLSLAPWCVCCVFECY